MRLKSVQIIGAVGNMTALKWIDDMASAKPDIKILLREMRWAKARGLPAAWLDARNRVTALIAATTKRKARTEMRVIFSICEVSPFFKLKPVLRRPRQYSNRKGGG